MRKLVLLSLLMVVGCGKARPNVEPKPDGVDLAGVLRVSHRGSVAHACAVRSDLAYTSAHVTDPRWYDPAGPLMPLKWSVGDVEGTAYVLRAQMHRDLSAISPSVGESFPVSYPLAKARPRPGDVVRILGYDWRTRNNVMADREHRARIIRIVAGLLVFDENPEVGSSGGCVLNVNGEVVGIMEAIMGTQDQKISGRAVLFWAGIEDERPRPRPVPPVVTVVE